MNENLEVFAVIVEQSSLNKASKVLNISQPALSRKIRNFEQQLAVELFKRQGKKLILTEIGQITYEYALEYRLLNRKYQAALAKYKDPVKESITVGASLTTLQSTLPDLISLINRHDSHTDIKAVTGKTHEIVTLVKEKKVDVGLVASKIEDHSLHCVPLFEDHLSLVVPKHHPLAVKSQIHIQQLNGLPMILFSKGTWYRILTDELFHRFEIIPEIKMEIDSFEAIIRLVSTCQAATLLPQSYLRQYLLDNNDLVKLDISELQQTVRTTSLIFNDPLTLNEATRKFIELAENNYINR